MTALLDTDRSRSLLFQRLVLGAVVLPHGLQKVFGWFDGYGIDGTLGFFAQLGVPAALGWLVILSDSLGAVALIAGLGTRLAAFGTAATMLGAILLWHLPNGFFMNWDGSGAGEGFEYHLLALGAAERNEHGEHRKEAVSTAQHCFGLARHVYQLEPERTPSGAAGR